MSDAPLDVLVLGAGISGLAALRSFAAAGLRVAALDKGRAAGGRMATRRAGDARFDHGAQFFTARDPGFAAVVRGWEAAGLARPWANSFPTAGGGTDAPDEPRWIGVDGMSRLARSLGDGLDVRVATRVTALAAGDDGWTATLEDATTIRARALVATAPVPQTLALLRAGGARLDGDTHATLDRITYFPCLALMVRLRGPSRVPSPGGLRGNGDPVAWIADNRRKGIAKPAASGSELTIHAGPEFSREHLDEPESVVTAALLDAADEWLGADIAETHLHRWRYSLPETMHDAPVLVTRVPAPVAFAGDAFGGPRVEGAYLSGLAAADAIRAAIA